MKTRYGFDVMSLWIVILALVLSWIPYGAIPALALVGWAFFRALSRNVQARQSEALWFANHTRGLRSWGLTAAYKLRLWGGKLAQRVDTLRKYKVFRCKKCGQKLRVPRGKGKIRVTCKNCQEQFLMKS